MPTTTKQPTITTYEARCSTKEAAQRTIERVYGPSKPQQALLAQQLLEMTGKARVRLGKPADGQMVDYVVTVVSGQREAVVLRRADGRAVDKSMREWLEGLD